MVLKEEEELLTKSRLKRLIKVVEIQKSVIRRQKKQSRIFTLYADLLEQWLYVEKHQKLQEEALETEKLKVTGNKMMKDEVNKGTSETTSKSDERDKESLNEIFDAFLENSNIFGKDNENFDFQSEMENIIRKDKIINDITNPKVKLPIKKERTENESLELKLSINSETEEKELKFPEIRTVTGQITGSSYQCYEIDFEILHEYLNDYLINMTLLKEELANEERVFDGYKFLLARERNKVDIIQNALLEKYNEEIKFMKMLKGISNIQKEEVQTHVFNILNEVYNYEDNDDISIEDIFTLSHLKWSICKIEIEERNRENLLFDMKMDLNEILDDIILFHDIIIYWKVVNILEKFDGTFRIEYLHIFENQELDEEKETIITCKGEPFVEDVEDTKVSLLSNDDSGIVTDELNLQNPNETNKTFKDEEDKVKGSDETTKDRTNSSTEHFVPIVYERNYRFTTSTGRLRRLKNERLDLFFLPQSTSTTDHFEKNTKESNEGKPLKDKTLDTSCTLELSEIPRNHCVRENKAASRSLSLPNGNSTGTKRKICRSRKRIKSEGSLERISTSKKSEPDGNKKDEDFTKTKNLFNIQTVYVDGEVIRIADLPHKIGSPRNQPRKLSFKTRNSLINRLENPSYFTY